MIAIVFELRPADRATLAGVAGNYNVADSGHTT